MMKLFKLAHEARTLKINTKILNYVKIKFGNVFKFNFWNFGHKTVKQLLRNLEIKNTYN